LHSGEAPLGIQYSNIQKGASLMENNNYVVSLEYRVYQSFLGRYFMGHTPQLTLPSCGSVWAALYNPPASGMNVFVNTFTVSNFSATPFRAHLWLNAMAGGGVVSRSCAPPTRRSCRKHGPER